MHKILVPLGISEKTEGLLNYAIDLSKIFKSDIYLIDAHPALSNLTSINNVKTRLANENKQRIKRMVDNLNSNVSNIKIIESKGDLIDSIKKLNKNIGIDLIITAPLNNEINDELFLGPVAGSLIKRTNIPVLVAPYQKKFIPPKKMMLAFKSGEVKSIDTLKPLIQFQEKFKTLLKLLLVKVPGFADNNHKLDDNLMKRSEGLIYSENATVYQGVLEQFQSNNPDMLVVFKRERGFFVKLWEPDRIYKRDFFCTIPLLVLKNKD